MDVKRLFGVILMAALLFPRAIYAQDGNNPPPDGGVTIHVVQRDENLYRIAMRYGTTVEAIAEANGIADPRYIAVGQRLLIPNAQINATGMAVTHSVKPGDTLWSLAFAYRTTPDQLAAANHLTNPATLFVGQELTINQGADEPDQNIPGAIHFVEPGENLLRIALRYGVTSNLLARVNDMPIPAPVFAGQRLWIPGDGDSASLVDLPAPLTAFTLSPIPAVQGKTIGIHVSTTGPATLTGTFMGYPVQFVTQDANQHYAIFGIHAFAAAGIYPMALSISGADGIQTAYTVRVRVDEGGYGAEDISLDTTQQDLLTVQVTEPEWQRVATLMSSFTAQRYFDGLMGLPSTGAITSQFGTRRIYNGGTLDTFHSGTDFGGGPGSPILAPAAGVVVLAENLPVRGNATIIDHGWGVLTGYWHQSEIYVSVGDVVVPGQTIGAVGSTGRSTGPHLHWEIWVGGAQVDPMQWVQQSFP
jgi:murein DD-endopeptidase MepM/ murein hydrolase activator NlpD